MKKRPLKAKATQVKGVPHSTLASLPLGHFNMAERLKLGSHKERAGFRKQIKAARNEWLSEAHDVKIGAPYSDVGCIHRDELEAAIRWECFRYLFFSRKLSTFWNALIVGNQFVATDPFIGNRSLPSFILGGGVSGFGAPWCAWADDPCFPSLAWVDARAKAEFRYGLQVAPTPNRHAVLLNDDFQSWKEIYTHAARELDAITGAMGSGQHERRSDHARRSVTPIKMPLDRFPLEKGSENISRIVVEIDWSSTKEEITKDFLEGILPIWSVFQDAINQGKKKTGRRDGPLTCFAGLVIRRRLDRGLSGVDAVKGFYRALTDRKSGLSEPAKRALRMADERLSQIAAELEGIEKKIRDEAKNE